LPVRRESFLGIPERDALVVIWLLVAGLLLSISDSILLIFAIDGKSTLGLAIARDIAFALASGAFIYELSRHHLSRLTQEEVGRRSAEQKLRTFLDAAPLAIATFDLKGSLMTWNPPAERIFGWRTQEVLGRADPTVSPQVEVAASLEKALNGVASRDVEESRRNKDGSEVNVLLTVIPALDESGKTWGAIEVMEDISERKLERAALIDTSRSFRSAFEDAAIGMAMVGLDGRWLKVNRALCDTLGYSEQDLLASTSDAAIFVEDRETRSEFNRKMIEGQLASYQTEQRYLTKNGRIIWVSESVSLVHDARGQPLYSIAQMQDVTAKKDAEEELKVYSVGLEKMVNERTEELEKAHQQLVQTERLAAIGGMAAQVAHDLRNPLTAINTNLYYIRNTLPDGLGAKVDYSIRAMEAAVEHSSKIVDDLLEYSRTSDLEEKRVDLGSVLKQSVSACEVPPTIKLVVESSGGAYVKGDPGKLKRVFQNLLSNAIEAMPDGGTITVRSTVDGNKSVVEVTDTGVGMDQKTLKQIFNPIFTTKSKGLGLGLPICQRLIALHGGTIDVQSELGRGTTVVVRLPWAPGE
jgi:PAS domain S-box-containing protein